MGLTSVRHWPILLKNSFSTDDGKILGVIRREARFRLGGGYMKELMSRCRTSWAACEAKLGQFFDCLDIRQDFAAPAIWSFSTESATSGRSGLRLVFRRSDLQATLDEGFRLLFCFFNGCSYFIQVFEK